MDWNDTVLLNQIKMFSLKYDFIYNKLSVTDKLKRFSLSVTLNLFSKNKKIIED